MTVQTWLVHLSAAECERRLGEAILGRLAVIVDGRPEIYPVSHVYDPDTGSVAFPTNEGTKLHGALRWPWVAFEVDGLDEGGESGWSVLVVGRAEELTDAERITGLARRRPAPWRATDTTRWVRIVPSEITGRRILAVEPDRGG